MITLFICLSTLAILAQSGLISHDIGGDDGGGDEHHKSTSYQNIHMEHFHAIPTYAKKEYNHLLEHPVSVGQSSSKVEVHHGGKHELGYAIVSAHNSAHGHGEEHEDTGFVAHGGGGHHEHYGEGLEGHHHFEQESAASNPSEYQVYDQDHELLQQAQESQDHYHQATEEEGGFSS